MPLSSATFSVFLHSWPIWAVVLGGLAFFKVCHWVHEYYRKTKRAF